MTLPFLWENYIFFLKKEVKKLRFQTETSPVSNKTRTLPYVFKELGKKCFGINKIEDKIYLERLLNILK